LALMRQLGVLPTEQPRGLGAAINPQGFPQCVCADQGSGVAYRDVGRNRGGVCGPPGVNSPGLSRRSQACALRLAASRLWAMYTLRLRRDRCPLNRLSSISL
jgi:hypothetical protein